MIRSLRHRHRIMSMALAVVVPMTFVAGLAVRPDPATKMQLDLDHVRSEDHFTQLVRESNILEVGGARIAGRLLAAPGPNGRLAVELRPESPLHGADLLAYWAPTAGEIDDSLDGAYLLGPLSPTAVSRFELPAIAIQEPGRLLIYSLAHQALQGRAWDLTGEATP